MAFTQPEPKFKVNAASLQIDPSLGVQDQGTIDVKAPADFSETGEANMPPMIGSNRPIQQKKKFFKWKAGGTLAEQLDTEVTTEATPKREEHIRPVVQEERNLSADDMTSVLTPKFRETPMESLVPPTPMKAAPVEEAEPLKADLKGLVLKYIQKVGPNEAAKLFGKPAVVIHNWINGKQEPPLAAAQAVLNISPKARTQYLKVVENVSIDFETGEGSFCRDHTKEELPVDLCLCTDKDLPPYVAWVFITAVAQYGIGMKMQTDTVLPRARNMAAKNFIDGKAEWSIWLDYDVLPTIGNPGWWRAITRDLGGTQTISDKSASYDFIKRLLSHKKPFVGGVYPTRRKGGPLVTQLDLHPRNQADRIASDKQRKNNATGLYGPVEWLSCGLACIHRVVFETIQKHHPEITPKLQGEPYPFFTQVANEGEDAAFCKRAIDAGFKLYLDQELMAAHIGRYPFLPGESAYNGPVDFTNSHVQ